MNYNFRVTQKVGPNLPGGAMERGEINSRQSLLECHRLFEYCCWSCASLHGHYFPSSSGYFQYKNAPCKKKSIESKQSMSTVFLKIQKVLSVHILLQYVCHIFWPEFASFWATRADDLIGGPHSISIWHKILDIYILHWLYCINVQVCRRS